MNIRPVETERGRPTLPLLQAGDLRIIAFTLICGVGYFLGARMGFALTFEPNPLAVLWPPNAFLLSLLLLIAPRYWWFVLIAGVFPAHILAGNSNTPLGLELCWYLTNVLEAVIGAASTLRILKQPPNLGRLADTSVFLFCCALLAPFLSSFLDVGCVTWLGMNPSSFWDLWRARLFSNMLAMLFIVPAVLALRSFDIQAISRQVRGRGWELALLITGLASSGILIFDVLPQSGILLGLLFLPLPFVLWAAMRFGAAGCSASFALIAVLAIWGSTHGKGPFVSAGEIEIVRSVQVFLSIFGATLLLVAAGAQESRAVAMRLRSSEARFAAAFRHAPDAMLIITKADRRVVEINERYLRIFGGERADVIGKTAADLNLPIEMKMEMDWLGLPREQEVSLRTGSGAPLHAILAMEEVDLEGRACLITSIRDVTELKEALGSLRLSDERFQLVMRCSNEVVFDWQVASDALWWNQNGDMYFGAHYDGQPCNADRWRHALHRDDGPVTLCRLATHLASGENDWDAQYRLRRADGSYAYIHAKGYTLRDEHGKAARMIGSLRDIGDRKRMEEANQRLAHVSRLAVMGELTASIAHEINQPLGAILSNADAAEILLNRNEVPIVELRQIIEDIRQDDMRAGEVIRHMRALMRRRELTMQPFDLNRSIGDVLNLASADLARYRVQVDTEFGPLPTAFGDQVHIQQVMLNLILNAVDAMMDLPVGRRALVIRTARGEGGSILVSVSDSGGGIAPDYVEQLFSSFFTTKQEGMGLGLSIAKSIVEAHGGSIRAENGGIGGAIFTFTLPAWVSKPQDCIQQA